MQGFLLELGAEGLQLRILTFLTLSEHRPPDHSGELICPTQVSVGMSSSGSGFIHVWRTALLTTVNF